MQLFANKVEFELVTPYNMIIMLKQKIITILLIGLMCVSSVSSFFVVMCHAIDGNVTIELAAHNHCHCEEANAQNGFSGAVVDSCTDHSRCLDTVLTSNFAVPRQKNLRVLSHKLFTANFVFKQISTNTPSVLSSSSAWSNKSSPFYGPLSTIVLLV